MWLWILAGAGVVLMSIAVFDLLQRGNAVLRNFPIIGHGRSLLRRLGPPIRQYFIAHNDEERPFTRDQRRWIYSSAAKSGSYFGFGTDNDLERSPNYIIIKHAAFPLLDPRDDPEHRLPCAKVLGEARDRAHKLRPSSVVNISGMSYGSLGKSAIEALNRGAALAGCLQNTGEGGISPYHLHSGELVWQIGTGYFGCRAADGSIDVDKLVEVAAEHPVRAIELKLSQGAKPGLGGLLPGAKVTAEIARIRGIPRSVDCVSPARHSAFSSVDEMLDFVEMLAERTGLPIGIKSAVGQMDLWHELAELMSRGDRGVDFITIDGGEGGTGAGPLAFTDHVALPFKLAIARVHRIFAERDLADRVVFIGSGKLGFPETALLGMALGCDLINIGREAMMAIGCIQAQQCQTGHCPTGVATHNKWLMRGLDPKFKAHRFANYVVTLRKQLLNLARACGVEHPGQVGPEHIEILDDRFRSEPASAVFR